MKCFRGIIILCISLFFGNSAHAVVNYQDSWWNPSQSGIGFMVLHQNDIVALAWYFFGSDGKATYLILSGQLNGSTLSGNLRRSTGPQPGPSYNPGQVSEATAGTATLTFTSSTTATFSYNVDGLSGSMDLTRFSFAQPGLGGSWNYAAQSTVSQCTNAANNRTAMLSGSLSLNRNSDTLTVIVNSANGGICTYSTGIAQSGSVFYGDGTFSCNNGVGGNVSFTDLRVIDDFLTINYSLTYKEGESCREVGKFGAVPTK